MIMSSINPFIVGIIAGTLTGVALLPQLIKLLKEKKPQDISWGMLLVLLGGLSMWTWYGIIKTDYIIIITNAFSILVNICILFFNFRFRRDKK